MNIKRNKLTFLSLYIQCFRYILKNVPSAVLFPDKEFSNGKRMRRQTHFDKNRKLFYRHESP